MESLIGEIIVGVLALVGSLIGTKVSNDKTTALISYRIEQLEKQVEKHNSIVERTFALEKHSEVLDEQMKVANHRIDDLESINRAV